jgi:hypothetical protein
MVQDISGDAVPLACSSVHIRAGAERGVAAACLGWLDREGICGHLGIGPDTTGKPGQHPRARFKTVRREFRPQRGYGTYLVWVGDHVEALESRVGKLQSESNNGAQGVSAQVADLVRTLDHVEQLRREADRIVVEAKAEAERIRIHVDTRFKAEAARAEAQRTLRDARRESDQIHSELASRLEAALGEVRIIREDMLDAARDLEATIELGVDRRRRS